MSKGAITVLITGGGAPGIAGTLYALRNNPDHKPVRVVACDMREDAVGKYLADVFYVVPPGKDPNFVSALLDIAEREHVSVILPQVTDELLALASNIEKFLAKGINIAVSSETSIKRANDKWLVLEAAKSCGVPIPHSVLTRSAETLVESVRALGYPEKRVVVKPRVSSGLRGLRVLSNKTWDVMRFLNEKPEPMEISLEELLSILHKGEWPELIVQEYLPGPEYTVDVFRGRCGAIAIPRLRKEIRSGITFRAQVELRENLQSLALRLADELELKYAFGFQFKLSEEGIPKVLECNPRIQGTMITAVFAGCNVIWWAVKEALAEEILLPEKVKADGLQFMRYWGGIAVYNDGTVAGPI